MVEILSAIVSMATLIAAVVGAVMGTQTIDRRLKQGVTISNPRQAIIVQPGSNAKPVVTEMQAHG